MEAILEITVLIPKQPFLCSLESRQLPVCVAPCKCIMTDSVDLLHTPISEGGRRKKSLSKTAWNNKVWDLEEKSRFSHFLCELNQLATGKGSQ